MRSSLKKVCALQTNTPSNKLFLAERNRYIQDNDGWMYQIWCGHTTPCCRDIVIYLFFIRSGLVWSGWSGWVSGLLLVWFHTVMQHDATRTCWTGLVWSGFPVWFGLSFKTRLTWLRLLVSTQVDAHRRSCLHPGKFKPISTSCVRWWYIHCSFCSQCCSSFDTILRQWRQ